MAYDRTLIQIRERGFLDLLDLSVVVIRSWPRMIGLASLVGILPFAGFNVWLYAAYPDLPAILWGPLLVLEIPWATAPLTLVLGGLLFGERPRPARLAWRLLAAAPAMVLGQFFVRGLLLATVVFSPLIVARLAFLDEVILLERVGGFRAIRRCGNLCKRREGELLGRSLALSLFSLAFIVCFLVGGSWIVAALIDNDEAWYRSPSSGLLDLRLQVALWTAIAFAGVVRFLCYIDQRIRLEGWAVELTLRDAGLALEKNLS